MHDQFGSRPERRRFQLKDVASRSLRFVRIVSLICPFYIPCSVHVSCGQVLASRGWKCSADIGSVSADSHRSVPQDLPFHISTSNLGLCLFLFLAYVAFLALLIACFFSGRYLSEKYEVTFRFVHPLCRGKSAWCVSVLDD
uniref:Putative IWS1 transcription factor n=1 Tax=Toxoplasma gondii TgCATBr9 TaxID=943120 RepID=A0A2T6J0A4_TOXGO|nr:putative IWS1 transcription factor [Toxoplasma gondii TgCATBr9]